MADLGKEEKIEKNLSDEHAHLKCFSRYQVPAVSTPVVLLLNNEPWA